MHWAENGNVDPGGLGGVRGVGGSVEGCLGRGGSFRGGTVFVELLWRA